MRRPSATPAERGLVEAKLAIPRPGRALIRRVRVIGKLRAATSPRMISVVAPPGYGKTATFAQLARGRSPVVAWLTADEGDNDPLVLVSYLAAAIGRVTPLTGDVMDEIALGKRSMRAALGLLLEAVANSPQPMMIVIDDAHRVTNQTSLDTVAEFVNHLTNHVQLTALSRRPMNLPLTRWRMQGDLLEIGPAELAMDDFEAAEVARQFELDLPAPVVHELVERTEGWPALLALAFVAAGRSGRNPAAVSSSDFLIADYLRSEVMDRNLEIDREFLTRTSILEHLSGPICDAVTGRIGSARLLADLAHSTLLVDEYAGSFRYHSLLREFLRDELSAREPAIVRELHRRAAAWYEGAGDIDEAVGHAFAAEDLDEAARLVGAGFLRYHWSARRATTRAWIERFSEDALEERPWLAVLGAWEELAAGDVGETERLANLADRSSFAQRPPDGTASFESGRAMLRALTGRSSEADMLTDAQIGVRLEREHDGRWLDLALWIDAIARQATGAPDAADSALATAISTARAERHDALAYCILGHRALLAIDRRDWDLAALYMSEGRAKNAGASVDGYLSSALACVARVRIALHRGQPAVARQELARGLALRPLISAAAPAFGVLVLVGFARAHLALGDAPGARADLNQATDILRLRPGLAFLAIEVAAAQEAMAAQPVTLVGASTLTAAELRVLALLPYYLTYKEIGERLGVQATTIKTQASSIFGKLGASTRSEAVELAVDAGLLERLPT